MAVGNMVIMMDDFRDPLYIKRIWCIFEVYVSAKCDIPCTVIMPSSKLDNETRIESINDLMTITRVDTANAKASQQSDEEGIKKLVRDDHGSFAYINRKVKYALCTTHLELLSKEGRSFANTASEDSRPFSSAIELTQIGP